MHPIITQLEKEDEQKDGLWADCPGQDWNPAHISRAVNADCYTTEAQKEMW